MKNKYVRKAMVILLAGVMAAGTAACGRSSSEPAKEETQTDAVPEEEKEETPAGKEDTDAGEETSAEGEKVVTALISDGLNPELADTIQASEDMCLYEMIYEPLVKYGEGGEIEPALAQSWEISEDGVSYTFHLRQDAKFSDGTDFNADSVIWNTNRWKDANVTGFSAPLKEAKKIDDYTVELEFEYAAYPCLIELTYPRPLRMQGESALDEEGNFKQMVGTGEWMIESYEPDKEVVLVPNPYYYGEKPKVDKVILKEIPDGQSRCMALQSGEADISIADIPAENQSVIAADDSLETYSFDGTLSFFLIENYDNPKLQDVKVRQALNYALDRQTMVDSLLDGTGTAATGLMTPNTPYETEENTKGYPYDPEKTKELLAEAGYEDSDGDGIVEKDGEPLTFTLTFQTEEYSAWKSVCEFIQSEYAKSGIGIELNQVESGAYYDAIWDTRDFELIIYRSYEDSWNPHGFIKGMFYYDDDVTAVCWQDKELSDLIADVLGKTDEKEKQEGWDAIFKNINENAYTVPLYYPTREFVYNKRLTGVTKAPTYYEAIEWNLLDKTE